MSLVSALQTIGKVFKIKAAIDSTKVNLSTLVMILSLEFLQVNPVLIRIGQVISLNKTITLICSDPRLGEDVMVWKEHQTLQISANPC